MAALASRVATTQDVAAIAQVHVASWRETYRGLMPDDFLASLTASEREPIWERAIVAMGAGRGCVFVAVTATGEIVGFASGGPARGELPYSAELFTLYLLAAYQGQGVGKGLFQQVVERLVTLGYGAMLLWVLRENLRARRFYEARGGLVVAARSEAMGEATIHEVAYGWPDLAVVVQSMER